MVHSRDEVYKMCNKIRMNRTDLSLIRECIQSAEHANEHGRLFCPFSSKGTSKKYVRMQIISIMINCVNGF